VEKEYKQWSKVIWARTVIPRHSSTAWFLIHKRLQIRSRMARFMGQNFDKHCAIGGTEEEDIDHLFFG